MINQAEHPQIGALLGVFLVLIGGFISSAATLSDGQRQFLAGDYKGCISVAEKALKDSPDDEEWHLLLTKALLATGQYPSANKAITNALAQEPRSVRLQWLAREVFLSTGQTDAAAETVEIILRTALARPRYYRDASSLVVFGQAALLSGNDPKRVLDQVFEAAKKIDPKLRDVYLASGELALEKHDFALAAKRFEEGLKQLPDDPDLHCGLAKAYEPNHQALMQASLQAALAQNSNHVGSLLLLADNSIDAEDFAQAEKLLDRINEVNPWQPDAWAYRAVLAHLQNQSAEEESARENALKFWKSNPRVDYLIGLKLSQQYRFAEGAAHQRQALEYDRDYLRSKGQLAQDLLRLGEETEGWQLAQEVQKQDGYDVEAFNLAALHDTMGKFKTLTNEDFVVRMSSHEAAVYGARVLDLLMRAKSNLCAKYGMELKRPTVVEMFPEQKDFAVRTFGMPGNQGYLGVCFGRVVTANSPAAHVGHSVNWEAVLWHEFCHVVTLQMTRNKMPRWLSEGISVYEESQANSSWGQRMNPRYREMVLGDELTPVSKLSAAFLSPPSETHLQFAYYESSLVVEFLIERFGLDRLKDLLRDLGEGTEISEAIEKHTAPMEKIEADFAAFARERAEKLGPGLDWTKPEFAQANKVRRRSGIPRSPDSETNLVHVGSMPEGVEDAWAQWAKERPTNFWALTRQAEQFVETKKWAEAKPILKQLVELYPDSSGPESAYWLLAATHRALGETNEERGVLAELATQDDEAAEAYVRLMELGVGAQDWAAVAINAQRYLAVNPLVLPPYRFSTQAAEKTGNAQLAIQGYRGMLELDPPDPAEVHYKLARLLHEKGDPAAREHVLKALEEAPRYRAALRLLLEINQEPTRAENNIKARR